MSNLKHLDISRQFSTFLYLLIFLIGSTVTPAVAQEQSAAAVYNDALAKLKEKKYEEGLPLMKEALKLAEAEENEKVISLAQKNGAVAAYSLGNSQRKAGDLDKALASYEEGVQLNPEYSGNYYGKAKVLEGQGNTTEAVKTYVEAGNVATKAGKAERGDKMIAKAGSMVGSLYADEKFDEAIEAGKAYLGLSESARVHYYLARAYQKKEDNENALTHISKAIEMVQANGETVADKYYWAKASALENMGKKQEAVDTYKKITGEKYKQNAAYKISNLGG